jgi:GT2 family glycosyltransferase
VSAELVVAVVLNWNRREDTLACLGSLAAVSYPEFLPLVVDNGSTDGSLEAIAAAYPQVELIAAGSNLGFAEGSNLGIRRALELGAAYVLLLNNDTEVEPGFVEALVAEARRRPDAAALCSKVLFFEPPGLIWFAGARLDPRSGYNGRQRGYRERDDGRFDQVVETDRACAASMLVRREVLDEVGLLDPVLFAYSEDTDWSLRASARGYHHYVVPASRVLHKVSASSGGESAPATLYYGVRNSLIVYERYAPLGGFGTARRRLVVVAALTVQALLSRRKRDGLGAVWQGYLDLRAGRLGQRSSR